MPTIDPILNSWFPWYYAILVVASPIPRPLSEFISQLWRKIGLWDKIWEWPGNEAGIQTRTRCRVALWKGQTGNGMPGAKFFATFHVIMLLHNIPQLPTEDKECCAKVSCLKSVQQETSFSSFQKTTIQCHKADRPALRVQSSVERGGGSPPPAKFFRYYFK